MHFKNILYIKKSELILKHQTQGGPIKFGFTFYIKIVFHFI